MQVEAVGWQWKGGACHPGQACQRGCIPGLESQGVLDQLREQEKREGHSGVVHEPRCDEVPAIVCLHAVAVVVKGTEGPACCGRQVGSNQELARQHTVAVATVQFPFARPLTPFSANAVPSSVRAPGEAALQQDESADTCKTRQARR